MNDGIYDKEQPSQNSGRFLSESTSEALSWITEFMTSPVSWKQVSLGTELKSWHNNLSHNSYKWDCNV
jgi:hypothetical protein